jgi:hypothetical protein
MRSFKVQLSDGGLFGIEQDFSLFASDIVEAAIKAYDLLNCLHESIRQAAKDDEEFALDPENIRIVFLSDEGELTGGEVNSNNTWAQDFANQMMLDIKKYLC